MQEGKAVVDNRPHGNRPAVIISNNIEIMGFQLVAQSTENSQEFVLNYEEV